MPLSPLAEPPTEEYIRELYEHNQRFWINQIRDDLRFKEFYKNEHQIDVPDTNNPDRKYQFPPEIVKLGEAGRITDLVTSFYVKHAPLAARWMGQKTKSPTQQDAVEQGVNEALAMLIPPPKLQASRFNMVLLGRACELGPIYGDAYYYDFPFKRDDESEQDWAMRYQEWIRAGPIPFVWQNLPPESTFPPSIGAINEEVLSTKEVTWKELQRIFTREEIGPAMPEDEAKQWDTVTLGIYSNTKHLAYCVLQGGEARRMGGFRVGTTRRADHVLRTLEHGLGKCAIRILPGMTTGIEEPGHYFKSVLYHDINICEAIDKRASEAATASHYSAMPMFKAWLHDQGLDEEGSRKFIEHVLMGDVIHLHPQIETQGQENIEPLFIPQFGQHTQSLMHILLARSAQISGATEGLEGSLGPAGQAAWARALIVDIAYTHFGSLTEAVVDADQDRGDTLIRAVSAGGEKITLNPRGSRDSAIYLEPEQLRDWATYLKGEYKLNLSQNKLGLADAGVSFMERAKQSGLPISLGWIMENYMNIDQPAQHLEDALVWDFMTSEEVKAWQMKRLLEEADVVLGEEETMGMAQFQQMAAGLPPQVQQALIQGAVPPQNREGMGGKRTLGMTQGMVRAAQPLITEAGGPTNEPRRI